MVTLSTNPRVLLTTKFRRSAGDYLDFLGGSTRGLPKLSLPCRVSPGLRFIKQNVPEVEILEFPRWHEYVAKLREGWDVVGFSFYEYEIDEIERMAEEARRHGVAETWAGNFGALDEKVPRIVDRVVLGPGEDEVAQLFGYRVRDDEIEHPAMTAHVTLHPGSIRHLTLGLLYTQRGCPFRCAFCQTPAFDKRRFTLNLESIERVLRYYRRIGIKYVFPLDEILGADPRFADELTSLLARYGFHWWAQTRTSFFLRYLDEWYKRGLRIPAVGVESMSQESLDSIDKRQDIEDTVEFARRTREKAGMFRFAFYIIGYPNMTAEDTLQDAARLRELEFDTCGVSVITPFPKTPLREELEARYGIFDRDYHHYKLKHLVWNHPHISPGEMQTLLTDVINLLNKPLDIYRRVLTKVLWGGLRGRKAVSVWRDLKAPLASLFINDRKQVFFPKLVNPTLKGG
jgi:radical SAM superfamily enzyme YgiQ (UPF0313 family)